MIAEPFLDIALYWITQSVGHERHYLSHRVYHTEQWHRASSADDASETPAFATIYIPIP